MTTSLLSKPQIFDDLFMKFMENISDETISFQEYKAKWQENKRLSFQLALSETANILQEKANPPSFSNFSNLSSSLSKPEEDITMIPLEEFMRKYQINSIGEFLSNYKKCVLFRINSKSMILLFISLAYFKTLIDNFKDKTFEDLIKKLEFFKFQVSRTRQLKLIEVFKALKAKIESNFPSNAFHSLINSLIRDKVFREGVIDLIQEIIVDLILNCNFHHIIQNRNIELKKFILQLRNSKNEEELLSEEMKTLISRCFLMNFNISYLDLQKNSLVKESFASKHQSQNEINMNIRDLDVWNQQILDFLVINNEKNEKNLSFIVLREIDYENYFLTKLTNNPNQEFLKKDSTLLNKENFDRKLSINSSFAISDPLIFGLETKGHQSPKESIRKKSILEQQNNAKLLVSSLTIRKMRNLMVNLDEDSRIFEKNANL